MSQTYALVPAPQPFVASVKEDDDGKVSFSIPEKRETKEPKEIELLRFDIGCQEKKVQDLAEIEKRENNGRYSRLTVERNKLARLKAKFDEKTKKREIAKKSADVRRIFNKEKRDKMKKMREKASAEAFVMLSAVHTLLEKKKDVPNSTFDNLSAYMKAMTEVHEYEREMGKGVEAAPQKKGKKKTRE